jgi:CheY-like chemotaxis protein
MSKSEKPTVLLVDDNEATCTLVSALLRREFEIEVASDGAEAIENLKTRQYASILLDLRMPHADGFAVLDYLTAASPETVKRVIIVTASLGSQEMARVHAYPICAVVAKPFEVETLLASVRQCAQTGDGGTLGNVIATGGPVILLLADLLRQRWPM